MPHTDTPGLILLQQLALIHRSVLLPSNMSALQQLSVPITYHCNLNCKCCASFAPLAKPFFLSLEQFESDIARLAAVLDGNIISLFLMGGEPLLHENCPAFFAAARRILPHTSIKIVTNGLLLMVQTPEFWQSARENRIVIDISRYPIRLNFDRIKAKLVEENVSYRIRNDAIEKTMRKDPLNLEGDEFIIDAFLRCEAKRLCTELVDGKLFICSTSANIRLFNAYFGKNLHVSKKDYIDIYDASVTDQDIYRFVSNPVPFCRYCREPMHGIPYGRSKRDITEWV